MQDQTTPEAPESALDTTRRLGRELLEELDAPRDHADLADVAYMVGRLSAQLRILLDALDAQDGVS